MTVQKITTHLWFDDQAEEAANFYVSIFKNSKICHVSHYGKAGSEVSGMGEGTVMTVSFELDGQKFVALNGGPSFTFTPAISLLVSCENQAEVDHLWEQLTEGGKEVKCGWLEDRYGLSWQIVPRELEEIFSSDEPGKSERAMKAMLEMTKIELDQLREA